MKKIITPPFSFPTTTTPASTEDVVEKINTIVVDRYQQLRLFLSMIKAWGWTVAIPDKMEKNDIVGLVIGLPHWVETMSDLIEAETDIEFTLPKEDPLPRH